MEGSMSVARCVVPRLRLGLFGGRPLPGGGSSRSSCWCFVPLAQPQWALPAGRASAGGAACVSTKASREVRKKKKRYGKFESIPPPHRVLRQKDGDFPVHVRPAKAQPIRDLHDSALDASAEGDWAAAPRVKPHKMREAVLRRGPGPVVGLVGEEATDEDLKATRLQATAIPKFNPERDLGPEAASELGRAKARELSKRNYKWMPNPYSATPGPLGRSREAESQYYDRYFDGRHLAEDAKKHPIAGAGPPGHGGDPEEFLEARSPKPRRSRISPKQFWIRPDYVTPDPPAVAYMYSQELKFAMMNEAHLVRKWRMEQPEGRAAGMPPGSLRIWMAFGYRAAQLACGGGGAPVTAEGAGEEATPKRRVQKSSLSTTLRFLQAMASVQAGPYSALYRLAGRAADSAKHMKPSECFFYLQALARLRLRHPRAPGVLQSLAPAWKSLPTKQLLKAANAVAKLDLASNLWAKPLKVALQSKLKRLSGRELGSLKSIAVMELFDDAEAMKAYLDRCEEEKASFWYTRHLQVVELHVHVLYPQLWESLDEHVRFFLQEVREAATAAKADQLAEMQAMARQGGSNEAGGTGSDSSSDSDSDDDEDDRRHRFDRNTFSSELHADVSDVLDRVLQVEHNNKLAAGPLTLDICHTPTMTVLEAGAPWQFYLRSSHVTALARRRHDILKAMGFNVVNVPYHRWHSLQDDEAKATYLRSVLPSEMLSSASRASLPPASRAG